MPPLHATFVMEQVLGHVAHDQTLRKSINQRNDLAPHWVSVTYEGDGALERMGLIPAPVRSTLRGYLQVRDGLPRAKPDVLFFHTHKPAVFQPDLMLRFPTVLSLDVTPRQYDELGEFYQHAPDGDGLSATLKHAINRWTFHRARKIIAWSHWVRESLMQDYGVPAERIEVIPPGVDLSFWTPRAIEREDRLPRVLFVGGDFDRKGGKLLLEWFRSQGRGRCELDIVTRSSIAEEPGIHVHRGIDPNTPQALALYHSADIFALPSLGECFGIAAAEAMAAGLPVVMTSVGGAADIVDDGLNGYLISPNDVSALGAALNRLVSDLAQRSSLGRAARQRAEHTFHADQNAGRIVEVLHNAAQPASAQLAPAIRSGRV